MTTRASEFYAAINGERCHGDEKCHWCGAPCTRQWRHDEPPKMIGKRTESTALHYHEPWICAGCWLFRRPSVTVRYLYGGFFDRQAACNHSWWMTPDGALAIRPKLDSKELLSRLLNPPPRFVLTLTEAGGPPTHIHQAKINDNSEVTLGTELWFTINNLPFSYTVYDLDTCLKSDRAGKELGTKMLMKVLGVSSVVLPPPQEEEKRPRGRPHDPLPDGKTLRRKVGK